MSEQKKDFETSAKFGEFLGELGTARLKVIKVSVKRGRQIGNLKFQVWEKESQKDFESRVQELENRLKK